MKIITMENIKGLSANDKVKVVRELKGMPNNYTITIIEGINTLGEEKRTEYIKLDESHVGIVRKYLYS